MGRLEALLTSWGGALTPGGNLVEMDVSSHLHAPLERPQACNPKLNRVWTSGTSQWQGSVAGGAGGEWGEQDKPWETLVLWPV